MDYLPWIVVHGAWVWRGALIAAAAAALYVAFGWPRLSARRMWASERRRVGPGKAPAPGLAGEVVTLAGRLEAEGSCERFEDGSEVAAATVESSAFETMRARAPSLALECGDERVALEGEVEVAGGSREYIPGKQPENLADEVRQRIGVRGGSRWPVKLLVFRSLVRGDPVRARGTLTMRGAEAGDYRESGHRYVLEEVTLISERPPRLRGPAPSRAVRPLFVAAVAYLGVFGLGGEVLDKCSRDVSPGADAELAESADVATQLLAATPFRRHKALERLENRLSYGAPGVAEREALVAVNQLLGDCAGAAESMLQHRQMHRALERASHCRGPRARVVAARAATLLGDLARASDEIAQDPEVCTIDDVLDCDAAMRAHLLAGRPAHAAELAERMATTYRQSEGWLKDDADAVRYRERLAAGYDCLAAALASRTGDRTAAARLERLASERRAGECTLLLADLRSGSEREELLAGFGVADDDPVGASSLETIAALLRLEGGPKSGAAAAMDPESRLHSLLVRHADFSRYNDALAGGLERTVLDALSKRDAIPDDARRLRGVLLAGMAREQALLLHYDEARALLARAKRDLGSAPPALVDLPALEASVELLAGDLEAAKGILEAAKEDGSTGYRQLEVARTVEALESRSLPPDLGGFGERSNRALAAGLRGDAAALAAELRANHYHESLFRLLAHIARWLPPAVLAHHLDTARMLSSSDLLGDVDTTIAKLCQLALIADAAGEPERAAERAGAAARLRAARQRRDVAVPLAVLEAL